MRTHFNDLISVEQIGRSQVMTAQGFLLCKGVRLARTGDMVYGPTQTPIKPGPDGIVIVTRSADELFKPEVMASFDGAPVTDDHPAQDISPDNWRLLAKGDVVNVRRGEGDDADCLVADLLVRDRDTINSIRAGKREVSPGYDAEYDEVGPGRGRQRDIIVNHVALVDRGRCGPRCAIGDHAHEENDPMATRTTDKKRTFKDRVADLMTTAFPTADKKVMDDVMEKVEKEAKDAMQEEGGNGAVEVTDGDMPPWFKKHQDDCNTRFGAMDASIKKCMDMMEKSEVKPAPDAPVKDTDGNKAIEGALKIEAPPGTADAAISKAAKAKDSASVGFLADAYQETAALAEIIMPGVAIPAYDPAQAPQRTLDCMCEMRRSSLDLAFGTDAATRNIITQVLGGKSMNFRDASSDQVRGTFLAVGNVKRNINSTIRTGDIGTVHNKQVVGKLKTPAEMNKANAEYWANKKSA